MSHLEERMQKDLNQVRDSLWDLGEAVDTALVNAKRVLVTRESALANQTVLEDNPINRDSRELDRLCHTFIARYLPGAGTLRELASTNRANVSLERAGDYAVTMCREVMQLESAIPERFLARIDALADESLALLRDSRRAFREGNADAAITLISAARRVQSHMDPMYEELFAADDDMDGRTMMVLFVIFNHWKRVADQAKNICDQTVYAVKGIAKLPKIHRFLLVAKEGSSAAQLAAAIGMKNFSETAEFRAATTAASDVSASPELLEFLEQSGYPTETAEATALAALAHDLGEFPIIVGLGLDVEAVIDQVPFHSATLNWDISEATTLPDLYRELQVRVSDLVELITGASNDAD